MKLAPLFDFDNSYARLPDRFYARLAQPATSATAPSPRLIALNEELARFLRLDAEALRSSGAVEVLAGRRTTEGSESLAMAYAGHQFGYFVPQLGDGRTNLLGEVVASDGRRYDVQLKGSGPTPFSRRGDGRAALGPVLREYVVSEAMAALGIPTTRALAAVTTGDQVVRETMQPGAVLTRVAASHLRVGTFQYFAAKDDVEALRVLAEFAILRHYPGIKDAEKPIRALLGGVIERQASLVAQWMMIGFIHGVMNTDNTSISGETIDYGPCAFLESYDPDKVFSSIDRQGRYEFANQPLAMHWNLAKLAEAMLPLLIEEEGSEEAGLKSARAAIDHFSLRFQAERTQGLRRKLGLLTEREGDLALAEDLLERMAANGADFTLTFRTLSQAVLDCDADSRLRALFTVPEDCDAWLRTWRRRIREEEGSAEERAKLMQAANPSIIARNHFVQRAIDAAVGQEDFGPFEELLEATRRPYDDVAAFASYRVPARAEERVRETFCGT